VALRKYQLVSYNLKVLGYVPTRENGLFGCTIALKLYAFFYIVFSDTMAAASQKGSASTIDAKQVVSESKDEVVKCGECKKIVADKSIQCKLCELWFHCKSENMAEDTYELMNQDKIYFYCGRCNIAASKLLRTILHMRARQKRLEEEFHRIWIDLDKRNYVKQEQVEEVVRKIGEGMKEVQEAMCKDHTSADKDEGIAKLQGEVNQLTSGMEN
jgi:hypothetical protein